MNVAILNREPSAFPGGDLIAIDALLSAFTELGVHAVYLHGEWTSDDLKAFDLVHIFHCNFSWSWSNFEKTWASDKPYVVTPVFYPDMSLGMSRGRINHALRGAKAVMPFSWAEMKEIPGDGCRFVIVPNGTSRMFHAKFDDTRRSGVLTVSARDGDKNTDRVRAMCHGLGLPYMNVSGKPCEDMPAIYWNAKVFVNASGSERMSLTIGEALAAGCRVLATKHNRGNEHYGPLLQTFDPDLPFMDLLDKAYHSKDWNEEPNKLARELTWERAAKAILEVYEYAVG